MYEVTVSGWFAAAHQLRLLDGRLEPLHGHNWRIEATFAGPELDGMGVLIDFTRVKPALEAILGEAHDRNLNDLAPFREVNPSAENVAAWIAGRLGETEFGGRLTCVAVEEAQGCVARYRVRQGGLPG